MIPRISEFSYGFALTNEIVRWAELSAAPLFPSLIAEGGPGGGFDVKLDRPGAPLFLQFKRSECMTRRSAREWKLVDGFGGRLTVPFYRFAITESLKSDQHELLLALDTSPNLVFYAAPRFHEIREINQAWQDAAVSARSVFVSPSEIGSLDEDRHSVAFDARRTWICSKPREIRALNSRELLETLKGALSQDDRPLRDKLPELSERLRSAEIRGRERAEAKRRDFERRLGEVRAAEEARRVEPPMPDTISTVFRSLRSATFDFDALEALETPEPTPPVLKPREADDPERRALGDLGEQAARVFDAQLVIVQPQDD